MNTRVRALCLKLTLAGILPGLSGGCGFHPLYAPSNHIQAGLSEIFVDTIPNRNGQLFRQALQERLQGSDPDATLHYELSVSYSVASQSIGIESDNASTRNRFIATAVWTLRKPGLTGERLTGGVSRTVDGNDTIAAQFFYSQLNSETVNRRLGEALADQITQALAVYFRAHPALI